LIEVTLCKLRYRRKEKRSGRHHCPKATPALCESNFCSGRSLIPDKQQSGAAPKAIAARFARSLIGRCVDPASVELRGMDVTADSPAIIDMRFAPPIHRQMRRDPRELHGRQPEPIPVDAPIFRKPRVTPGRQRRPFWEARPRTQKGYHRSSDNVVSDTFPQKRLQKPASQNCTCLRSNGGFSTHRPARRRLADRDQER
jgi:hypothetical protein